MKLLVLNSRVNDPLFNFISIYFLGLELLPSFSINFKIIFFSFPKDVGASFFGDILQPQNNAGSGGGVPGSGSAATNGNDKLVGGDLESSLANLTSNLNLQSGQSK